MRTLIRLLLMILLFLGAAGMVAWGYGPVLIAPAPDFPQGPGAVVAYVPIANQLRAQARELLQGAPVRIVLTEGEFSGLVSSALLSGWRGPGLPPKVRTLLVDGVIRQEAVLRLQDTQVPERFRGPIGLRFDLAPEVTPDGPVRLRIAGGAVGRIPLSPAAIRWAVRTSGAAIPGFDPTGPALTVPVEPLLAQTVGRPVRIQSLSVGGGKVTLVAAAGRAK